MGGEFEKKQLCGGGGGDAAGTEDVREGGG